MGRNINIQSFEMKNAVLRFDIETAVLLCQSRFDSSRKLWVKKLNEINVISDIVEDGRRYYIACESGEINGQFIAIQKENGVTEWFIPGKSFFHLIYKGYLYLIFIDENDSYYLLKVHSSNGKSAWFHPVSPDLSEYVFMNDKVKLAYKSGRTELISIRTGKPILN